MLIRGRDDVAALDEALHGGDVVESGHQDVAPPAGRLQRRDGAQRHAVVGAEDRLDVCALRNERRDNLIGTGGFPLCGLRPRNRQPAGLGRIFEAALALDAVERVRRPLQDRDRISCLQALGHVGANDGGAFAVVRPDEGDCEASIGQRVAIEPVVDIDDDDAGIRRLLGDTDKCLRICGREHDGADPPRDHLIDDGDLPRDILFVLDARRDQLVAVGV